MIWLCHCCSVVLAAAADCHDRGYSDESLNSEFTTSRRHNQIITGPPTDTIADIWDDGSDIGVSFNDHQHSNNSTLNQPQAAPSQPAPRQPHAGSRPAPSPQPLWREEIQNRNRLLDFGGKKFKIEKREASNSIFHSIHCIEELLSNAAAAAAYALGLCNACSTVGSIFEKDFTSSIAHSVTIN